MLRWLAFLIAFVLRLVMPCKVYGKENLTKGNTVYMCNHQSAKDVVVLFSHLPLNAHIIAKKEIFKNKFFSFWLNSARVFPVDRSTTDLKAIKHAMSILKNGDNLMIFPQGTRKDTPVVNVEDMHAGVGMMALKNESTVIPMMFKEKPDFFKKNTLYIGKPLDLEAFKGKKTTSEVLREFNELATERMNALLEEYK